MPNEAQHLYPPMIHISVPGHQRLTEQHYQELSEACQIMCRLPYSDVSAVLPTLRKFDPVPQETRLRLMLDELASEPSRVPSPPLVIAKVHKKRTTKKRAKR